MNHEDIKKAADYSAAIEEAERQIEEHQKVKRDAEWELAKLNGEAPQLHLKQVSNPSMRWIKNSGMCFLEYGDFRQFESVTYEGEEIGYLFHKYAGMGFGNDRFRFHDSGELIHGDGPEEGRRERVLDRLRRRIWDEKNHKSVDTGRLTD